jgi:hypothetical protein
MDKFAGLRRKFRADLKKLRKEERKREKKPRRKRRKNWLDF